MRSKDRRFGDVLALEEDPACVGAVAAEDQAEERGLARSVRPDQAMDLSRVEREVDLAGNVHATEAFAEPACLEDRHVSASCLRVRSSGSD
jgi:hypothetical protein